MVLARLTRFGCFALLIGVMGNAYADIVVVVSAANPVESLSRSQLADIYLGRLRHFPNGEPVAPVDQKESAPAHDEFYNQYLGRSAAEIKAHWSKLIFTGRGQPPHAVADGRAVAKLVAGDENTIGYLDATLVDAQLKVVSIE